MTEWPRCPRLLRTSRCDLHDGYLPRHRRYCTVALANRPTVKVVPK